MTTVNVCKFKHYKAIIILSKEICPVSKDMNVFWNENVNQSKNSKRPCQDTEINPKYFYSQTMPMPLYPERLLFKINIYVSKQFCEKHVEGYPHHLTQVKQLEGNGSIVFSLRFHICSILRCAGQGPGSKSLPCLLDLLKIPLHMWQL